MRYELKSSTYIPLLCFDNVFCHNYIYTSFLFISFEVKQTNQLYRYHQLINASRRSFGVASFPYAKNLLILESHKIKQHLVTLIAEVTD